MELDVNNLIKGIDSDSDDDILFNYERYNFKEIKKDAILEIQNEKTKENKNENESKTKDYNYYKSYGYFK